MLNSTQWEIAERKLVVKKINQGISIHLRAFRVPAAAGDVRLAGPAAIERALID
jgi:hypothetical protein